MRSQAPFPSREEEGSVEWMEEDGRDGGKGGMVDAEARKRRVFPDKCVEIQRSSRQNQLRRWKEVGKSFTEHVCAPVEKEK